ncbi:MAG: hypothetical protein U0670_13720 [Anaerolineae bacterium]
MKNKRAALWLLVMVFGIFAMGITPAFAGETILSDNSGTQSVSWFISGEASLVMNGFDLRTVNVNVPAVIDAVTINVDVPVPGVPSNLVIYQDANGGSPVDAQLVNNTQVTINTSGGFRVVLPTPVTVTQPIIWIGFYLPVGLHFWGDRSGSSVLTYWAWTPGGTFDLANLSSAQVFGPGDGSAPVNLNMGGKARITAEITGAAAGGYGTQTQGAADANMLLMQPYPLCFNLLYDSADETISFQDRVNLHCQLITNTAFAPANPPGYSRRGELFDIVIFGNNGQVATGRLDVEVTHCIRPAAADLETAVIGNAFGSPRQWRILPTQRFGDMVCAEIRYGGNISYFVPGV